MKKQKKKIVDGRYQIGLVTDWIMRKDKISYQAKQLYITIALYSLNVYHKRQVNIGLEKLPFKDKPLKKYRDELVSLGLIEWKNTKAYTCYWLKEPYMFIKDFKFIEDEVKNESDIKTSNEDEEEIDF